jgi:hypothetical protein
MTKLQDVDLWTTQQALDLLGGVKHADDLAPHVHHIRQVLGRLRDHASQITEDEARLAAALGVYAHNASTLSREAARHVEIADAAVRALRSVFYTVYATNPAPQFVRSASEVTDLAARILRAVDRQQTEHMIARQRVMALRRDVARLEQEAVGLRAEVAEAAQSRTALLNEIAELRGEPASVEGDQ